MRERRRVDRRQGEERRRAEPEHAEQKALFYWARLHEERLPELIGLFAIPNGRFRPIREAVKLKAEGVRRGVPDVCLAVPRHSYHGLFLEMKAPGRVKATTEDQLTWHIFLRAQGYRVALCDSWQAAWNEMMDYLDRPDLKQGEPAKA